MVSKVLPMGYLNSVGIAQHLHRNLLKRAQGSPTRCQPWSELRKDRTWSLANPLWRVYLDNLDILEKTRPELVHLLDGDLSPDMSPFVDQYHSAGIPLNAKKSVKQAVFAEVQGAEIDGEEGFARPKGEKIAKYASATLAILDGSVHPKGNASGGRWVGVFFNVQAAVDGSPEFHLAFHTIF